MPFPTPNARPWPKIISFYDEFKLSPWGAAMHHLVVQLDAKGYVNAGLNGTTSMMTLILGHSTDVLNNPRLKIPPTSTNIQLQFDDGSPKPWNIEVEFCELTSRIERLLIKRLRWFRGTVPEDINAEAGE